MPIDIDALLAADPIEWDASWTTKDVILYHLGIGAGVPATDPGELRLTYEPDLVVMPSFGTVPGFLPIPSYADLPGFDIDLRMLVHGEHDLVLHRPLPTEATATSSARAVGVYDKRSGASVVFENTTTVDGEPIATNTMTAFIRGEGGFGGDPGPSGDRIRPPRRDPDSTVRTPTLAQQALLYRLSGDANPLHADPAFAAVGGFDRPILHGMCTFGIACKAAVQTLLDGDTTAVTRYQARFSGVVLPGDTLEHALWREDDSIVIESRVDDRAVLKQARLMLG
ncbi:MaoC/PaaZ C-terminal domain-containing protein [Euzebya rosea]|uniref:MaoC/PaaZ C-terminal domain-containing protein n=1 Tax=Euzebya rosea TaxID=2052804 RepID=UPI000D3ECC07|nr:MaoC/PaaZ C-terminal domain-containing protein [Euzebya rosea]